MPRKRNPKRAEAKELWENARGKMTIRELSEKLSVSQSQLRQWKAKDNWTAKKPRGAPAGNQNAKGRGPAKEKTGLGNQNAATHGAYSQPNLDTFTPEQRQEVDTAALQMSILGTLTARKIYLENRIEEITQREQEKFTTGGIDGKNPITYWDSKDKWLLTLQSELTKVLKQMQKIVDQ